jgi:PPM family protein phosphatase
MFCKRVRSKSTRLKLVKLSTRGRRTRNEDHCSAIRIGPGYYFLAIADGMGGISGGEVASRIVLSAIVEYLKTTRNQLSTSSTLKKTISEAFLIGQTVVADFIKVNRTYEGMGTTLVAVLIKDGEYVWANIGDSRIYILSGGVMKLLTEDHSYIQDYLNNTEKELPQYFLEQYQNIITKVIDGGTDKPDIYPADKNTEKVKGGDIFFLCSDGLILNKITDYSGVFREFVNCREPLGKTTKKIVRWALSNGADDNISIVLGKVKSDIDLEENIKVKEDELETVMIFPEKDLVRQDIAQV